ncbi:hypothetical protein NQZ68_007514, partial [Dissostichus eleginoides]
MESFFLEASSSAGGRWRVRRETSRHISCCLVSPHTPVRAVGSEAAVETEMLRIYSSKNTSSI